MVVADYRLFDILLSMFAFFLFVAWIWLLISVYIDIFRSHDLSGIAKAAWVVFVFVLPLIGVLVYLIARGGKMQQHSIDQAKAQDDAFKAYVQHAAGSGGASTADELTKLAALRDSGVITPEEFEAQKAKHLS